MDVGPEGPRGPVGPQGEPGPQGAPFDPLTVPAEIVRLRDRVHDVVGEIGTDRLLFAKEVTNLRKFKRRLVTGVVIIALACVAGLWGAWQADQRISDTAYSNCRQIQSVKGTIVLSLRKGLERLETNPPVYYKTHPEEYERAKQALRDEIDRFRVRPCNRP